MKTVPGEGSSITFSNLLAASAFMRSGSQIIKNFQAEAKGGKESARITSSASFT